MASAAHTGKAWIAVVRRGGARLVLLSAENADLGAGAATNRVRATQLDDGRIPNASALRAGIHRVKRRADVVSGRGGIRLTGVTLALVAERRRRAIAMSTHWQDRCALVAGALESVRALHVGPGKAVRVQAAIDDGMADQGTVSRRRCAGDGDGHALEPGVGISVAVRIAAARRGDALAARTAPGAVEGAVLGSSTL